MSLRADVYQPGDELALNALYQEITGNRRRPEWYRWQWLESPEGPGTVRPIKETGSGEIVGHFGLMPLKISYFGRPLLLGKTENCMMHPRYKGQGVYIPFERRFTEQELQGRYQVLLTPFAFGHVKNLRAKVGYRRLDMYAQYFLCLTPRVLSCMARGILRRSKGIKRLLTRAALAGAGVAAAAACSRYRLQRKMDWQLDRVPVLSDAAKQLDAFWDRNKARYGITIWRSSDYINWRYFKNPYYDVQFYVARCGDAVLGQAALQLEKDLAPGVRMASLVDAVVEDNDPRLLSKLIAGVVARAAEQGIELIRFRSLSATQPALRRALRAVGFLKAEVPRLYQPYVNSPWMVRTMSTEVSWDRLLSPANWYATDLFSEGVDYAKMV